MCKSSKICKKEYFNNLNFKSISDTKKFWMTIILSKKCPNTEFFLVRTLPYLPENGNLRKNTNQKKLRI